MGKIALEAMPRVKLNTGTSIPAVGLGTWQSEPGLVGQAVKEAVKVGYRHIDCAKAYGNEKEVGDALQELYKEGIVKREDLWITSKLWCTDHNDVAEGLEGSIERLQCGYLDLYLAYSPIGSSNPTIDILELPTLTKLAKKYGKTSAQIALRWNVQQGHSVLPKSTHSDRLASNIEIFDFELSKEDLSEFDKIEQQRLLRGDDLWVNDTTSPYKSVEELWDSDI